MRDVAALAGVGIKTVSRVVNEEPNVSGDMRERVQRAIVALSFQPHLGAGSLRRGDRKTLTLGLLLDAVDNPFSAAINRAVETVASRRNTAVFAASSDDDPDRERQVVAAFTRRRVDGLILTTITPDQGYLQTERDQGTPIVLVDRAPVGLSVDSVRTDNRPAAMVATRHLLQHGHRQIAGLADDLDIATARDRLAGFDDALHGADLPTDPGLRIGGLDSERAAYAAVVRLLERPDPPTALFTSQNLVTIGAVRALHDLGRHHDIAVVGFDDLPMADLIDPAITVMAQNPIVIGTTAAERVFARIDGDDSAAQTAIVPAHLVIRGSGEIPPPH